MTIKDVKDLRAVLKLCREFGIDKIKVDNIELELGEAPAKPSRQPQSTAPTYTPGGITEDVKIETEGLSEQDLLFYSVTSDQQ